MKINLLLFFLLFSNFIKAGDHKGNGADVIVCPQNNGEKQVLFLDYVEAEVRRDIIIDIGNTDRPYLAILDDLLKRIETIDYTRAKRYRIYLNDFSEEVKFITDFSLGDVLTQSLLECKNEKGKILQLVVQITPRFKEDKRYFIDKTLWDQLSERDKAGVILHEFIMREIGYKRDPEAVRYLTSLYSSQLITDYRLEEYFNLLKDLGFKFASFKDIAIDLNKDFQFHNRKKYLLKGYAYDGYILKYQSYIFPLSNQGLVQADWNGNVFRLSIKNPTIRNNNFFWPYYERYDDFRGTVDEPSHFTFHMSQDEFKYQLDGKTITFPRKLINMLYSAHNWVPIKYPKVPFTVYDQ